jgi:hypothetical protein
MKTTSKQKSRSSGRSSLSKNPVQIRIIKTKERKRFETLMGKYHYLGEGHSAGDTMRMVAERDGEWVGLLMWGSACYRLKPRDEFIGWSSPQRAQRQKLIVQNRRFSLLADRGAHPNLASHILGAAIRDLPRLWYERFGYQPLLAESFTDIEVFEGTCYRAAGWQPVGLSKGYSRHRADFYIPNERPKKLWVRELRPNACALLRAMELPPECNKGAQSDADGVLPFKKPKVESLHEALCKVPDPRARNRSFQTVIRVQRDSTAFKDAKDRLPGYYQLQTHRQHVSQTVA